MASQPTTAPEEVSATATFLPPSINPTVILSGHSYTYSTPLPRILTTNPSTPCVLGIDEAGRGPVLGPMVYGVFYLPVSLHHSLLSSPTHRFDDSKALTPQSRAALVEKLCCRETPSPTIASSTTDLHYSEACDVHSPDPDCTTRTDDLYANCGWATTLLSAVDIGADMLRVPHNHNLNAQAYDATVSLIRRVLDAGVNVAEVYVDTVGPPAAYQRRLAAVFPTVAQITVAKKADALFPCVSAASVVAKVTRDAALGVCWRGYCAQKEAEGGNNGEEMEEGREGAEWGSGYPSDGRCMAWLKGRMDPLFGWGRECRFSWSTARDMLEEKGGVKVDWLVDDEEGETERDGFDMAAYCSGGAGGGGGERGGDDGMIGWFGGAVEQDAF
ncbi:MAG: hypothetical protein M1816_006558 [Peltula sp. TS41687]|nr:MAG: hypothetical protein M1816_006558 [Peltula sp. TS41687]